MEEDKKDEHEISMEIEKDDETEAPAVVKHQLMDLAGWKKDFKKIAIIIASFAVVAGIFIAVNYWTKTHVLGLRVNMKISRVHFDSYTHIGPDFSFKFPRTFAVDEDQQNKYGDSYLGGVRLKGDARTGCDVRSNPVGINFQKTDKEIHDAVIADLSGHIKDFKEVSSVRTKIGGENAYTVDFSFTDPLGDRIRVSQAITSHDGDNYVFVCGTGEYQYDFFVRDFDDFFKSFRWTK